MSRQGKIAIIDYNAGNINSVMNALERLGADFVLTGDISEIKSASKVILPGVGNASFAMEELRRSGLIDTIRSLRQPVLGICVGMQVLCNSSQEENTKCIGIFDSNVLQFPMPSENADAIAAEAKVPHMGWNSIQNLESKLFKGIEEGSDVYFVHSFYPTLGTDTIATSRHGNIMFSAALKYENFYGTQFHPEKSGDTGERILKNFLAL